MKEDESKTTTAAAEQPETAQPVENVEASDTGTAPGGQLERPDEPRDGEGCEAVTVCVVQTSQEDQKPLELCLRSLEKNLREADAKVEVLVVADGTTLEEVLRERLDAIGTERIVLMTDRMAILNPVTLADIAVVKADARRRFSPGMPAMMRKSVLLRFLGWKQDNLPYMSLVDAYMANVEKDIRPLPVGDWTTDPWVLPVVSGNPSEKVLREYAAFKRFLCVRSEVYPQSVKHFLEERFRA